MRAASERLQAELDTAMRAALAGQHATALGICLHGYSALGAPQAAEQVHNTETPVALNWVLSCLSRYSGILELLGLADARWKVGVCSAAAGEAPSCSC
jgi:hypothetical protein